MKPEHADPPSSKPPRPIARREGWGTAVPITDDLWRIRLRNPRGALMINTYVHHTADTLAVIDPGWPWTLETLERALVDLELAPGFEAVDVWLYTHSHIDHMGSALLLQRRSQAPHVTWKGVAPELGAWHAFQDRANDWRPWTAEAFAEPHRSRLLEMQRRQSEPGASRGMVSFFGDGALENVDLLAFGESIDVGSLHLTVVDARGHDPYHIAFWEPERRWLFAGDVVLATPTPISRAMDDDLGLYRQSLDRLQALGAAALFPGHGIHHTEAIDRCFERSRDYLEQYRSGVLKALYAADAPQDLYSLGLAMTPDGQPLSPDTRWWVHLALIDSHLQELAGEGLVERVEAITGPMYLI